MPKKILSNLEGYKLYRHTSPSGKVYIGITKTSVYARWMCGRGYRRNCHVFHRAILKYGWDNIKNKSIIHCCTGGYFCKTRDKFINVKQAGGYIWKYKEDLICH